MGRIRLRLDAVSNTPEVDPIAADGIYTGSIYNLKVTGKIVGTLDDSSKTYGPCIRGVNSVEIRGV
eukprot:1392260-Amorphochlora_amoeboformis.AAC.1